MKIDVQTPATMIASSIGAISGINECATFFQWAKSTISALHSQWTGSQEQDHTGRLLQLESGLERLRDTLPTMKKLIHKADWKSHEDAVASLLPNLKDALSVAEDLLDEFRYYGLKVQLEGNASQSPSVEFFDTVIKGNFNKLDDVLSRWSHLSSQMENMGLPGVAECFDKAVRLETTYLSPGEIKKLHGRDNELNQVLGFLNVLKRKRETSSMDASTSTSASNHVNSESSPPVFVIDGIGGVGKTTLVQHICSHRRVQSQFEKIIWICVSNDFDAKRLIKEAIQSFTGLEIKADGNLQFYREALKKHVNSKRLLIVLDDVWDDALKGNGWDLFCGAFSSAQEGSAMLVTTRCPNVTEGVCTMESVTLQGLKDGAIRKFFKSCAFGSEDPSKFPDLELIGESMLPKLQGSPLCAITLGRMLRSDLRASHWNSILNSELWTLEQKETDILPALRLSYIYLPFYLKRCFEFCAVYPKDYKFQKERLAEIWVAEGFVEPQGSFPVQDIACQYFEDLVARSFFQKVNGRYVIHDLIHDMAQMVSKHNCFILRNKSDFDKVPQNVRHLYVLPSSDFDDSNLLRLGNYTNLRTLICMKFFGKKTCSVMDEWCAKLLRIRVISFLYTRKLPDSIGNWKHLRYLEICRACPSMKRIPSTFCCLYNLQILYAMKCKLESLPGDFGKLINLQKFEPHGLTYHAGSRTVLYSFNGHGIKLMKNLNQLGGRLEIDGCLSTDHAAEVELKNKICLDELELRMDAPWGVTPESRSIQNQEVLQVLQPPISLKSLFLEKYAGVSLPSWFQPRELPSLESLTFRRCDGLESINLNAIPEVGMFKFLANLTINGCGNISSLEHFLHPDYVPAIKTIRIENCGMLESIPTEMFGHFRIGMFKFLANLTIDGCGNISSLEHFLHPDYVPAIKTISIANCGMLESIPTEMFGHFRFLEELAVCLCPNINIGLQILVSPSLKKLTLFRSGLFYKIDCCSLTYFVLTCWILPSINLQTWSLPSLLQLTIKCNSLTSIGSKAFPSLNVLKVSVRAKFSTLDDLLTQESLPAIETIHVEYCPELLSLPVERFESFANLKHLVVSECPNLNWQRGLVLPSYLELLTLCECGDISAFFPSCLQNLTSLVSLSIAGQGITSIPGDIWRGNLASLEELTISHCPDLVSIGGARAVGKIRKVLIYDCPNLEEAEQINKRYFRQRNWLR